MAQTAAQNKAAAAKRAAAKPPAEKKAPEPTDEELQAAEEANAAKAAAEQEAAAAQAVQVPAPPQDDSADLTAVDEVPNPGNEDTLSLNEALENSVAANLARANAQVDDSTFVVSREDGRTPTAVEQPVPEYEVGDYVQAGASAMSNARGTYYLDEAGCVESFEPVE